LADLVIANASQILTCAREGLHPPFAGRDQGELGIRTGGVAVENGRIVALGPRAAQMQATRRIDARGGVVLPGFVDCHTHTVFCGDRAEEFEERARGVSYEEIARHGGGIRSSMRMLREVSQSELEAAVHHHLDRFLDLGTTSIEAKSGYGLSAEHELRALRALGIEHPIEVTRTCLAAHEVPPEYEERREEYTDLVCDEIYPAVAKEGLAEYCDIFVEDGVFSFEEGQRILSRGRDQGLRPRVHADQLSRSGGARLACRVDAISADHLEYSTREDAAALRDHGVIAVLLPAANYALDQEQRPPARAMVALRCPIAIATDFNPGSAPTQSMPLVLNMACVRFGLSVAEAIVGATINAACAIGRAGQVGSIELGKQADLLVTTAKDHRELAYWFGANPVRCVIKRREVVRGS